jgi:ribonucleoside-diphosphate reductase alpha chain
LNPFTPQASFDFDKFKELIKLSIKFLDDVVTYNMNRHALPEQSEASAKDRRIGLGITGLGDTFFKLGMSYGDKKSKKFLKELMFTLAHTAYRESIELAKEGGPFPAFVADEFVKSDYMKRLIEEVHESGDKKFESDLKKHGIRNVTLLTIAPVGTGSEILGGVSSGVEPIFAPSFERTVKFSDGVKKFTENAAVVNEYYKVTGRKELPDYFVSAHDLSPELRIEVQAIMQQYIDSAISSTINLPNSATVEDVSKVYMQAYKAGLKGITVYREGSREGILRTAKEQGNRGLIKSLFKHSRDLLPSLPSGLPCVRYRVNYRPNFRAYIVIGGDLSKGTPMEVIIQTKASEDSASAKELGILLTAQLRRDSAFGLSSEWLVEELNTIHANVGAWHKDEFSEHGRFITSLAGAASYALSLFMQKKFVSDSSGLKMFTYTEEGSKPQESSEDEAYSLCEKCHVNSVVSEGGCFVCKNCGNSRCS